MNPRFTDLYLIHQLHPLTNIVADENVQPRVYTFVQKKKSQTNDRQAQQDIGKIINESPLTHPLFNSPKAICTREDSQRSYSKVA